MLNEKHEKQSRVSWLYRGYPQVVITGIIAFCCPGFFNAIQGLGGAGNANPSANDPANIALYVCFAIFGYLGGFFFNILGPRILMCVGGLSYAFYAAAAYVSGHVAGTGWLFILAGAVCGLGAGWLWTAQGALMMAYAPENKKGHYITTFWVIFNLGGFIGGILQFALNFSEGSGGANASSYFVFIAIMAVGGIMALFLLMSPSKVVLEDGSKAVMAQAKGAKEELLDAMSVIFDKNMLLLVLLFFGSNFFYTYVFNCVNGVLFTIRTRGLNSALYWLAQMAGAWISGLIQDDPKRNLARRAKNGFWFMCISFNITYALGCYLQYGYHGGYDRYHNVVEPEDLIDLTDYYYWYPLIVYILYGFSDSVVQTFSYWIMGAIAGEDTGLAARYTGLYKGVQSVGAVISWTIDLPQLRVPYSAQFWICWILFIISLPTTYLITRKVGKKGVEIVDAANYSSSSSSDEDGSTPTKLGGTN
ncbi:DUF895 domain membrane protein [Perkinsus olseni]|uniref:DUF895 domain membrane protein n=1 Tax=Perkinsus olseni TaxID=32597 RepID=A0A7J6MBJ1_PEROL|nr:DUF895 domain membrane protein [Perkinsus olseni]